jgi:hypothetical protein
VNRLWAGWPRNQNLISGGAQSLDWLWGSPSFLSSRFLGLFWET